MSLNLFNLTRSLYIREVLNNAEGIYKLFCEKNLCFMCMQPGQIQRYLGGIFAKNIHMKLKLTIVFKIMNTSTSLTTGSQCADCFISNMLVSV